MESYRPVTPAIVAELRTIVGDQHVIFGEPERMVDYAHDEAHGQQTHMPDAVVKPDNAGQISEIMRLANRERIPVTPRGAGSGLSGGAVAVFGGILLSVERMNRILEIDLNNLVAVVEPGVITNDINEAVRKHGLFYAGYPMSVETCFIGGNVAENAGGGRAVKYGVTGRYVLGLEVVLPTGEIVEMGGKRVKDVTGYDLVHLMVGSEGTLGIFTRIILRLLPFPANRTVLLIPYPDVSAAIATVPHIVTEARVVPSSIEFMDKFCIESTYALLNEKSPYPGMGAFLLIELDGPIATQLEEEAGAIADVCLAAGGLDVFVADTPAKQKKMWRVREKVSEALDLLGPHQASEDVVVPPAAVAEMVAEIQHLEQKYAVLIPNFGHAGDGNIHSRIIHRPDAPHEEWEAIKPAILAELYAITARLGGTISGEHGIGSKRAPYLSLVLPAPLIELHRRIKQAFDPLNVLNPGKIVP
jgi:glycolate oxidase